MSFRLTLCGRRLWSSQLRLFAPFLWTTFSLGEGPSLFVSKFTPRCSNHCSFITPRACPWGPLILGENHQSWDWFPMIRSHNMTWTAQLTNHTICSFLIIQQKSLKSAPMVRSNFAPYYRIPLKLQFFSIFFHGTKKDMVVQYIFFKMSTKFQRNIDKILISLRKLSYFFVFEQHSFLKYREISRKFQRKLWCPSYW